MIDFVQHTRKAYCFSFGLILISIILFFTTGPNFGIDFTGGTVMELSSKQVTSQQIRRVLDNAKIIDVSIQRLGNTGILLKSSHQNNSSKRIKELLDKVFAKKITYKSINYVGPQITVEFVTKGIAALLSSLLGIMLYICLRFNWRFSISGVVALIHDTIITFGFATLLHLEITLSSVVAILTIIGYSINDSVVIYDRIRTNTVHKKIDGKTINRSINSTLSRTTFTSLTTLLALLPLMIIGNNAIQDFSIIIFFGIVIGTYSSIFIAAPLLLKRNVKTLA